MIHRILRDNNVYYSIFGMHIDQAMSDAIVAAVLVQIATFLTLVVVGYSSSREDTTTRQNDYSPPSKQPGRVRMYIMELAMPSFAAGSMLAATVFLIIPEAVDLLKGSGDATENDDVDTNEKQAKWLFGTSLICGFLFPIFISAVCPPPPTVPQSQLTLDDDSERSDIQSLAKRLQKLDNYSEREEVTDFDSERDDSSRRDHSSSGSYEEDPTCSNSSQEGDEEGIVVKSTTDNNSLQQHRRPRNNPNIALASSILLGDTFHNLCDGLFVGTAFLLCSRSLAWAIVATSIYHQLAQELVDYFLLTQQCNLSMIQALTLNFISGCSMLLGVIVVFYMDLPDNAIGAILSGSAGVYLYVAVGECLPRIQVVRKTPFDSFLFFTCFIVGAVPVGLVLMNDMNCQT